MHSYSHLNHSLVAFVRNPASARHKARGKWCAGREIIVDVKIDLLNVLKAASTFPHRLNLGHGVFFLAAGQCKPDTRVAAVRRDWSQS